MALYGLIARMLLYTAPRTLTSQDNNRSNQARLQVVKMLITVVTIFATLWLPWRGLMVFNTVASLYSRESTFMDLWYLMFAKTCIYINSAINPILYNALSTKFRHAFRRTLSCGRLEAVPSHHSAMPAPSVSAMAHRGSRGELLGPSRGQAATR